MKKVLIIFLPILAILIVLGIAIRDNVKSNVKGKLTMVNIKNIRGLLSPVVDVDLTFQITNNSWFKFAVNDFKADIYNSATNTFLTENMVLKRVEIPIGVSSHKVELLDNKIIGTAAEFLSGDVKLLAIISFRVLGIKIKIEENIKF